MHPACVLIVWVCAVLLTQFVGYAGLAILAVAGVILSGKYWRRWLGYVRRARWLLLTLWLILAFNTPGEAWMDFHWAPTREGIVEANLQATRLIVMLCCLTWMTARLGLPGIVAGLWSLLRPLARLGVATERLVVRLSLVLDNLQSPPEKGAWRRMLAPDFRPAFAGPAVLALETSRWRMTDTVTALLGVAVVGGVLLA